MKAKACASSRVRHKTLEQLWSALPGRMIVLGAWSVGVAHGYDGSGLWPVYVTEGCFGTEESLCDTAGGFT
jgi:hypothetical protein